jgi:hypothetical protein
LGKIRQRIRDHNITDASAQSSTTIKHTSAFARIANNFF